MNIFPLALAVLCGLGALIYLSRILVVATGQQRYVSRYGVVFAVLWAGLFATGAVFFTTLVAP